MIQYVEINKAEKVFLNKLYIETHDNVEKIFRSKISSSFDIDDCISRVFIVAATKIYVVIAHENPDKWIYVVAYNILKEFYREMYKRKNCVSINDMNITLSDIDNNPEEKIIYYNLLNYIYLNLKQIDKEWFHSIYILDMGTDELSRKFMINYSNTTTKVYRIKKKAKKIIKKYTEICDKND